MSIKKMKIYSMLTNEDKKNIKNLEKEWEKYFNIDHQIITTSDAQKLKNKKVDILFVSDTYFNKFSNELINNIKSKNNQFNFVIFSKDDSDKIIHYFKNYADHVFRRPLNTDTMAWKTIAILRRYWNTYSKPTTLLYKNIIADFVENKVFIDRKEIELTSKEIKLLWHFMNNIGEYISKEDLFKKVWGIDDKDSTRVLNQMIFKLKNKIGKEYFNTLRLKGIKFS